MSEHADRPALTPEEWETFLSDPIRSAALDQISDAAELLVAGRDYDATLHAGAALALHYQPFGFTWEMVDEIRWCAQQAEEEYGPERGSWTVAEEAADRIAALLPPREGT